jgi:hypothetical protein
MKRIFSVLTCAGLVLSAAISNAGAASKNKDHESSEQTKEVTIVGYMTLSNDGKTYVIKTAKGFTAGLWYLPASKYDYDEYEMLEVKAVCMRKGADIISVKSLEPTDKAAFKARQAEKKEAAAKEAAEKEAAAKKAAEKKTTAKKK